jgi:N,N'-diacetyllegionaminate synthase
MSLLIIAEAGVNHNGDIGLAKQLINVAAESGADVVKFQTFSADSLVTMTADKADYQILATGGAETQHEMLRRLELSHEMHWELISHCKAQGIMFLSTGFDVKSVEFLRGLGQTLFKIPSGEINNLPYLRCVGQFGKEVILSTGMSTIGEIDQAIDALVTAGTSANKITLLHCTSEYPAPVNEVNLRAMQSMQSAFGMKVGYSDHTQGIEVAIAAVAMGASVIEKHFTLDRNMTGPDHRSSLLPIELNEMVRSIRNIQSALGDGRKRPSLSEAKNRNIARKSIVASKSIKKDELFSLENITTKRPGNGISPMRWDEVLGRVASRDYAIDELIEL